MGGKRVCFAPWKEIDIYPSGRIDFCSWIGETLNIRDFILDDKVDWDALLNSPEYKAGRKGVLEGKYSGCLECCPMIELDGDPIYGC